MTDPRRVTHNPAFLEESTLVRQFVVRRHELDELLETVRENTGSVNQHVLVIGRRGFGKTTLVRRLVAAIRSDSELSSKWFPVLFGEEAYAVSTAGEFWLEALLHLGDAAEDPRWQAMYEELEDEQDDQRLAERALARLRDFADERGVRLLIVVENLHMLLEDQMHEDEAWSLRKVLLGDSRIMLLATATHGFAAIEESRHAMFELFKRLQLLKLEEDECDRLWADVTGQALGERGIRPVQILTGGNPRLVQVLASFAEGRSLRSLMDDLTGLLDDQTDYLKHNIEALSSQERKVFVALLDLWKPVVAREVAAQARLDVNKTSTVLGRLVARGAVEVVRSEGRVNVYQAAERLYNIYHLARRRGGVSARVRAFVDFAVHFYNEDDLAERVQDIVSEACRLEAGRRDEHFRAIGELLDQFRDRDAEGKVLRSILREEFLDAADMPEGLRQKLKSPEAYLQALQSLTEPGDTTRFRAVASDAIRTALASPSDPARWLAVARRIGALFSSDADLLADASWVVLLGGEFDEALVMARRSVELAPMDATCKLALAEALLGAGMAEEAVPVYQELAELLDSKAYPHFGLARAYRGLGLREDRLSALQRCIELEPQNGLYWNELTLALLELERYPEAVESALQRASLSPNDPTTRLLAASILSESLGEHDAAIEQIKLVLERSPDHEEGLLRLTRICLYKTDQYEEALPLAERLTQNKPSADNLALLAEAHLQLQQWSEAEEAYSRAIGARPGDAACHLGRSVARFARLGVLDGIDDLRLAASILESTPRLLVPALNFVRLIRPDLFDSLAELALEVAPNSPPILAALAWNLRDLVLPNALERAAGHARHAAELAPEDPDVRLSLAAVRALTGAPADALTTVDWDDDAHIQEHLGRYQDLLIDIAASDGASAALDALTGTEAEALLEPFVTALAELTGAPMDAPREIAEVAADVCARIGERRLELARRREASGNDQVLLAVDREP